MIFSLPLTMKYPPNEEDSSPCLIRSAAERPRILHRIDWDVSSLTQRAGNEGTNADHDRQQAALPDLLVLPRFAVVAGYRPPDIYCQSGAVGRESFPCLADISNPFEFSSPYSKRNVRATAHLARKYPSLHRHLILIRDKRF